MGEGEDPLRAAIRELWEEIDGLRTQGLLEHRARIFLYFNRAVVGTLDVYTVKSTGPEARELRSKDLRNLAWYPIDTIPHERLFGADAKWLPKVLKAPQGNIRIFFRSTREGETGFPAPSPQGTLEPAVVEGISFL